jgi:sulfur carrier protein ThiS
MTVNREKITSFRVQGPASPESIAAALASFTWESGPVIVAVEGSFGLVQVWASTLLEGERVIGEICFLAGIDWRDMSKADVSVSVAKGARFQARRRYRLKVRDGLAYVSSRQGSGGLPEYPFVGGPQFFRADPKGPDQSGPARRHRLRIVSCE